LQPVNYRRVREPTSASRGRPRVRRNTLFPLTYLGRSTASIKIGLLLPKKLGGRHFLLMCKRLMLTLEMPQLAEHQQSRVDPPAKCYVAAVVGQILSASRSLVKRQIHLFGRDSCVVHVSPSSASEAGSIEGTAVGARPGVRGDAGSVNPDFHRARAPSHRLCSPAETVAIQRSHERWMTPQGVDSAHSVPRYRRPHS
jgi:hypothetical protein